MSVRIERLYPRCPKGEQPYQRGDGRYELADPTLGPGCHKIENAIFAGTLEDAADLIETRGSSLGCSAPESALRSFARSTFESQEAAQQSRFRPLPAIQNNRRPAATHATIS